VSGTAVYNTMAEIARIFGFCTIGLAALNVLLCILSLSMSSWIVLDPISSGLWKLCTGDMCLALDILPGKDSVYG